MLVGADRLAEAGVRHLLRGSRLALLAHPASVDRRCAHVAGVLRELGDPPELVFAPEHGYGGEAQDMVDVADATDAYGTPVRSLYGADAKALVPRSEELARIEVLVIDLQDVGARYYTFVWTALLAMRECARAKVRVVVLDRPNPIGGEAASMEGRPHRDPACLSFVGLVPTCVRHSLTLGEMLAWRCEEEHLDVDLTVVRATWDRTSSAHAWDRPFVQPSPNMPTPDTALVYPGGCLVEGTNLSEGRGCTRPFEIVGAPWIDGRRLARDLSATGLAGFCARPLVFQPAFHKHAGTPCGGVQLHPTDARTFRPYATYLALVALARAQAPDRFAFRTERYELRDDVPAYDLLTGCSEARTRTLAGDDPRAIADDLARTTPEDAAAHARALQAALRRSL